MRFFSCTAGTGHEARTESRPKIRPRATSQVPRVARLATNRSQAPDCGSPSLAERAEERAEEIDRLKAKLTSQVIGLSRDLSKHLYLACDKNVSHAPGFTSHSLGCDNCVRFEFVLNPLQIPP